MPQSATPKLGLYRALADGSENFNLVLDLLNNFDKIDAAMGATAVTSSTRPASAFNGQVIRETDTGRIYVSNGTLPGSASFGTQPFVYGVRAIGASASRALRIARTTDTTEDRYFITEQGTQWWGSGSATLDTNLYRSGVDNLKTDDNFTVGGDLTVLGIGQRVVLTMTSDRVITSQATPQADAELTFTLAANAKYNIEVRAAVTGNVGDFRTNWTAPASATGFKFCMGPAVASTNRADTTMRASAHNFSTNVDYGTNDTNPMFVREEGLIATGASGGSWTWNRSQATSSASATTVSLNSYATIERVG